MGSFLGFWITLVDQYGASVSTVPRDPGSWNTLLARNLGAYYLSLTQTESKVHESSIRPRLYCEPAMLYSVR